MSVVFSAGPPETPYAAAAAAAFVLCLSAFDALPVALSVLLQFAS